MKEKLAEFLNVIFGLRKFIIMLLAMVMAIAFRIKGLISGDNLVDLLKATIIAFFGANGVEHIVAVVKDVAASKMKNMAALTPETLIPPEEVDSDDSSTKEEG